jgi:uncharacterized protein involved in outer membrane biogenesis
VVEILAETPVPLLNSLTGNGQISISDGKITSFDLMKQVETIGRFVNLPTGGAATAFRQLRTNLRFEPGVMRTDALQIAMTDLSATGEGAVRFGDPGQVDYAILARLSPTLTQAHPRRTSGASGRSGRALSRTRPPSRQERVDSVSSLALSLPNGIPSSYHFESPAP